MPSTALTEIGHFEMNPHGPFEAGGYATLRFRVTIGRAGLAVGGCLKIGLPNMGWEEPKPLTPLQGNEVLVGTDREHNPWKPLNTTWRLETASDATLRLRTDETVEFSWRAADLPDGSPLGPHVQGWRWWLTATVERADLAPGDLIEIVYGDTENQPFGVRVQPWCEADPEWFVACIDARGTKDFRELDGSPVTYKTYPGPPESIVAVLPSLARVGETAPLRLAVLDRNLMPPRHALPHPLAINGENGQPTSPEIHPDPALGETDPDTNGFRPIPAKGTAYPETPVAVPDPGIARIEVAAPAIVPALSNPCVVRVNPPHRIYWGDLHTQSRYHVWKTDEGRGASAHHPADIHAYARDCTFLDFVAITDSGGPHAANPGWQESQQAAIDAYEPGRYVSLKGWECGMGVQGDRCVVYRDADIEGPIARPAPSDDTPTPAHALLKIYRNHPSRVLTIAHSFMKCLDWTVTDPELDRVMEIYSAWGCYESRMENTLNTKRQPKNQSAQHAWSKGLLLGITAAGDSHIGFPGRSLPYADRQWCHAFKPGLCAVLAPELTREAVWDALYDRRCYGTTGARIVLDVRLGDAIMGSIVECDESDPRLARRSLRVCVAGTDWIRTVDVLKNNEVVHTHRPRSDAAEFVYEDTLDRPPSSRDWYYIRVLQADGNMAWSSPIWIGPRGVEGVSETERE